MPGRAAELPGSGDTITDADADADAEAEAEADAEVAPYAQAKASSATSAASRMRAFSIVPAPGGLVIVGALTEGMMLGFADVRAARHACSAARCVRLGAQVGVRQSAR